MWLACRCAQTELEGLFAQLDRGLHGAETGVVSKEELRAALEDHFQVGRPGGKTLDRFDEIMQVPCCCTPRKAIPCSSLGAQQRCRGQSTHC